MPESRGLTLNRRSQADREGGKLGGRSQIAEANLISGDGFWCDPEFICHEGFGMHGKMANEDARSRVSAGYQQQNYETVPWRIDVVDHVRPHTLARLVASNRSSSHPQCQDLAQSSWGWARDRTSGPRKSGPLQTKFQTAIQVASLMDLRMCSLFAFPIHACTEKLTNPFKMEPNKQLVVDLLWVKWWIFHACLLRQQDQLRQQFVRAKALCLGPSLRFVAVWYFMDLMQLRLFIRINPKARKMQLWNLEHKLKEWFLCFFLNSETFNHWRMKSNIPLRYPSKPKCLNRRMRCREALSLQSRAQPRGIWLNLVVWVRKYSMHAIS